MSADIQATEEVNTSNHAHEAVGTRRWSLPAFWQLVQTQPNLSVAIMLLLLSVIFMSPGLLPGRVAAPMDQLLSFQPWHTYYPKVNTPITGGDLLLQQLPWRHWAQQEIAAGRFPLWASSPAGGMPLFASMQPGVLYPLHLLWILIPVEVGLGVIMALRLWLAGLGVWFFLRALGLHPAAALLSALGFMFSAWFVDWLTWQHTSVYLLLPWMAWAVYAWCCAGKRAALPWLALLVGCGIFGGHPETLFIIGIVVAVWALSLLDFGNLRKLGRQTTGLAIAVALGAALGAIQLLPFLSILDLTRTGITRLTSGQSSAHLEAQMMFDFLLPRTWGHLSEGVLASDATIFTEGNGYFGLVAVLGLFLAVIAAVRRRLPFRLALPWLAVGILAWLITFDENVGASVRGLPGFDRSNNVRWVAVIGFGALVTSAFGWDWLARQSAKWASQKRASLQVVALALTVAGLGTMAVHAAGVLPSPTMEQDGFWLIVNDSYRSYWAIWTAGVSLALLGATALWASAWRARWLGPVLLAAVLVLDLWRLLFTINGTAPIEKYYPATSFLNQVKALVPSTERILTEGDGLPSNTALVFGIRDWRAQDPMLTQRAYRAALMLDPDMRDSIWTEYNMFLTDLRLPVAPLLGVQYFIFPAGRDPNLPGLTDKTVPQFTRLAYKEGLGLWKAEGVPGFTYLSDNIAVAANEREALSWMNNLDWTKTRSYPALVEANASEVSNISYDPSGSSPGSTSVLEYTPGHIKIRVEARHNALLVVAESWYPGWRATLDGNPVGVLHTNYLSQGVVVPAGTHTVDLEYSPGAFKYGALLSGLSLLGLVGLGVWARRARA